MSNRYRNRAIVIMVLVQFAVSFAVLVVISPLTLTPSSTTSDQRIIVLPVYSSDSSPSTSIGEIQNRMQNVASYFDECSYSQVSISSSVVGWIRLDALMDSYAYPWNIGGVEHGGVKDQIFIEAISKVDAEVDFSQYDRLIVVHAGPSGQDADRNYTKIGTCHTQGWFATGDGRVFLEASIVSEFDEFGTIAHELGHGFGAPDLYDYHSEYGAWTGIGRWGLMNTGNHNGNPSGSMPSHMCVYNKHLVGWIKDREILVIQNESLTIDLIPVSIQTEGYRAIRCDLDNGLYYLVEARSQTGYDIGLTGSGVLVMLVNETRITERKDGVQLQVPAYAEGLYDAALREGEVFYDSESGFSVRVTKFTDDIVTIDVSTNPVEEWAVSERIRFDEGLEVRDVWVTTTSDDFYVGDTAFVAVNIEKDDKSSIQVYKSTNYGRDWEILFDTNDTDYYVYPSYLSFSYYQGMVMLTGRMMYESENSFFGNLAYTIGSDSFSVINFTDIFNYNLYEVSTVACPDSYYACFHSRINGTSGITYFRLSDSGWSSTFRPVPELIEIQISNVPQDGEAPFILYRDGNRHLRLVRFNETSIIHNVTAEYNGVWNIDIICSHDTVALSYIDSHENNSFHVYTVEVGSVLEGFSEVVAVNRSEYLRPVSLSYNNLTDTFHNILSISGDLMYLEFTDSVLVNRSIDIEGASSYCYLPRVDYSASQLHLIRIYHGYDTYSLSSITWIHIPLDPVRADVFYHRTASGLVLPVYFVPIFILVSISAMYFVLRSDWAMKIHDRSLGKKVSNLKIRFVSTYLEKTQELQPFFLNIVIVSFNVILSVTMFHLMMQLLPIGSMMSQILHNLRNVNLIDPVFLMLSIIILASFLIYLVRLEKPLFYVKIFVWCTSIVLARIIPTGWNIGWFLLILTLSLWMPLWLLTSLEIKHTKWDRLLKVATDSLSNIDISEDDSGMLLLITDTLEELKNISIKYVDSALTDEVLFSNDISLIKDSIVDTLGEISDCDDSVIEMLSKFEENHENDTDPD